MAQKQINGHPLVPLQKHQIKEGIEQWVMKSKELHIFVCGKVGTGKSSLINSLLGIEAAKESSDLISSNASSTEQFHYTSNMSLSERQVNIQDVRVTLWDTKGFQDPFQDRAEVIKEIAMRCKDNADLFVCCINMIQKPSECEIRTIEDLTKALGKEFWKSAIFALTFANQLAVPPGSTESQTVHFVKEVKEWEAYLNRVVIKTIGDDNITRPVPVIPMSYRTISLPIDEPDSDCYTRFWNECIARTRFISIPALLTVTPQVNDLTAMHSKAISQRFLEDFQSEHDNMLLQFFHNKPTKDIVSILLEVIMELKSTKEELRSTNLKTEELKQELKSATEEMKKIKLDRNVFDTKRNTEDIDGIGLNLSNLNILQCGEMKIEIIETIMDKWKLIGDLFNIKPAQLTSWRKEFQGNSKECCRSVLCQWINDGGTEKYPATWKGLYDLLIDIKHSALAYELKDALSL